jgi:hypothetical protein
MRAQLLPCPTARAIHSHRAIKPRPKAITSVMMSGRQSLGWAAGEVAVNVRGVPVKQDREPLRLPPGTLDDRSIIGGGRSPPPPHP